MNVGVILAAGEGTRMGFPKQIAEYKGETLIKHINEFVNSFFEPFDEVKVSNHLVNNVPKYFGETPESLMEQWNIARQYGTDVHLEIENWIKEGVTPKDVKSIAATKWIGGYVSRPNIDTFSEVIVYSKELGIAGTVDVLMMNKNSNEYVLID